MKTYNTPELYINLVHKADIIATSEKIDILLDDTTNEVGARQRGYDED